MAKQDNLSPGEVARMIINPFYAITVDEGLTLPHEPMISEKDWIEANMGLLDELGPEAYLGNLLSVLKATTPAGRRRTLTRVK